MEGRTSFLVGFALAVVVVLQGCGGGGESPAPVPAPGPEPAPTAAPGPPTTSPPTTPAPPTQPPKRSAPKGKGIGVYVYDHVNNDAGASFKIYTGEPSIGGWVRRPDPPTRDWDINDVASFNKHGDSSHGGLEVPGAGEVVVEWSNGKICTLSFSSDGRDKGICEASSDCGNNAAGVPAVHASVDAETCSSIVFSVNVVPDPNAGPATPAPPAPPTSPPAPTGAGIGVFVWNHLHNDQGVTFELHTGAPSTGSWVSRPGHIPRDWGIEDTKVFDKLNEGAHGGLAVPGAGTMQVEWSTGKTCTLTYSSDGKANGACSASSDCGKNSAGLNVFSASVDKATCESITFSADVAPPVAAASDAFAV